MSFGENRQWVRHLLMAGGFFLFMVLVFSMARKPIGVLNSSLLALTGELRVGEGGNSAAPDEEGEGASTPSTAAPIPAPSPPDMLKPTFTRLPKTAPVYAVVLDSLPGSGQDARLVAAPPLRRYTGLAWTREKTDLHFASDGSTLYVSAYCYDRNPADLYIEASRTQGANLAWQDDSIELFLMRNAQSPFYVQYIVSASGSSAVFRFATVKDLPHVGASESLPEGFRLPYVECDVRKDGYRVVLEIDVANLGIDRISAGDQILCQLVRNYRGYKMPDEVNLQLFPAHIYADNRFDDLNHHRSAFQPLQFIGPDERAKLLPPPADPFAAILWE